MDRRKIYYVPGLISLIFLPILMLFWISNYQKSRTEYSIDLGFKNITRYDSSLFKYYRLPAIRDYIEIEINKKNENDNIIYSKIELLSRAINIDKDSILGIKVVFNDIKYGSFIQAINSCLKSGIKTYYPYGDTLYIYFIKRGLYGDNPKYNLPQPKPKRDFSFFDCVINLSNCTIQYTFKDYLFFVLKDLFKFIKDNIYIYIGLLIMIFLSIRWIFLFYNQSKYNIRVVKYILVLFLTYLVFHLFIYLNNT